MTDTALNWQRPTATASFFTRRMQALLRLMRIHRRRRVCANQFRFADDRVVADVGIRRDRHRDDWLMALGR